jgi:PAS domain S-box-containing protein
VTTPPPDSLLGPLLDGAALGVGVLDAEGRYVYANERLAEVNGVPREDHIGRTVREVIPHLAATVERFHGEVLSTRRPVRDVQIRGSTHGAPDRVWQVSYVPLETDGGPAVGAILIDVTERENALRERQRRVRQHAAVADLGRRALSGVPVDDLLDAATEVVTHELEADMSGVLELTEERDRLVMCAGAGFPPDAVGRLEAELGRRSQAGYTLMSDGPVLTRNIERETRFEVSEGMRELRVRSTISTPIPGAGEPYGVLGAFSAVVDHFDDDDAEFVRAVASVLGHALVGEEQRRALAEMSGQRGRLVAQALEAGEREQRNVADVLHDDVLQHLLFARQELTDAASEDESILRARSSVEAAASLLRRVVAGLHPVTLSHAGLAAALDQLAGEHRARTGLRTSVEVDPAAEGRYDRLVVSLVRELLVNVAKHAGAARAAVTVELTGDRLLLRVADDGCGMTGDAFESALARGNIGLATARERVEAVGGMAKVCEGLEGRGTAVEIALPL